MTELVVADGLDVKKLLAVYLSEKKNKNTIDAYRRDIEQFYQWLSQEKESPITKGATLPQVLEAFLREGSGKAHFLLLSWRDSMIAQQHKPNTINRRLAAIRSLSRLARQIGLINWQLEIQNLPAKVYKDTAGPGLLNLKQIFATMDRTKPKAIRDYAILRLLFDLALRRGEIVSLNYPQDVFLKDKKINILGKAKFEQISLSLPSETTEALSQWIEQRGGWEGPLFINFDPAKKGERLSGRSIDRNVIKPIAKTLGIKFSPHGLRHTAISEAISKAQDHGLGLEEVLDFSRHATVNTMMIYRDRKRNVQGKLASLVAQSVSEEEQD